MKSYICASSFSLMMRKLIFAIGLIFVISATSCLTKEQVIYLQDKGTIINDSIAILPQSQPYRVQTNDILSITVKALDPELTAIFQPPAEIAGGQQGQGGLYFTGFTIDDHGNIEFPVLGKIQVLGLTLEEVKEKVTKELLNQYFKETAQLFVTVKLAGLRFTVMGEVGSGGTKTLFQDKVNIIEALANSGDIKSTGNRKDVLVIRQYPQGQKIHHIDVTDIVAMQSPYYYVKPNDIIYVKPLNRKFIGTGETALQNLTLIASVFSVIVSTYFLVQNL